MMIVGPPSASRATVERNLPESATPLFRNEMLPELWAAGLDYGIDPVGMVAQSGKETKWGGFDGDVKPDNHNTAGIKWHDKLLQRLAAQGVLPDQNPRHPLAFMCYFATHSWAVGADVHARHLNAWADRPSPGLNIDPRADIVRSLLPIKGPAVTWADLGGRWAPSETYGTENEDIMRRLAEGDG